MELKPCPLCGGEAAPMYPGARFFEICCMVCNAETDVYDSIDEAATAWNQRAERTCRPDDSGRCKCGTLVRWRDNCEPYETCDGLIAYKSIHPPVTRYYDYCPSCGAKVVD